MRIGKMTNSISCEASMQLAVSNWLCKTPDVKFVSEIHVPEVKRRADFIAFKIGNGLINIEAKCHDFKCMLAQLDSHAEYCDYSFAFIPDFSGTPGWFKSALLSRKYGLIVYNYSNNIVTEVFEAHHNKPKNTPLRIKISDIITNKFKI